MTISGKPIRNLFASFFSIFCLQLFNVHDAQAQEAESRWWKGNLHTHSLWSDGDEFPEVIAKWYVDHDYNFLALTDHNILSLGERWMDNAKIVARSNDLVLEKYHSAFGAEWVENRTIDRGDDKEVAQTRLKTLEEFRGRFEQPGKFLMIQAEEVSDSVGGKPVHLNASNLAEFLRPAGGESVRQAIDNNLRAIEEQSRKTGRTMLMHLNHPNFGWAVTAEDLAWATRERFFEVFNGHPGVNQLGDSNRASIEEIWDIVNTLRIDKLDSSPLYGLGTDDSHEYHGAPGSRPGRAWVMVRSDELSAESLIQAMHRGDFYASSGITLSNVVFESATGVLSVSIVGEEGVSYSTKFIGTRKGYNQESTPRLDKEGKVIETTQKYSSEIGEVLMTDDSLNPVYKLQGDELYVRAIITSTKPHPDPSFADQVEQAWTQPVGWMIDK
jgi:hypothetical protein